jgi:pimeloyl-ACP methyl ester carboxylesterase
MTIMAKPVVLPLASVADRWRRAACGSLAAILLLGLVIRASAATPAAVIADPPLDKAHPAAMVYVRIPSHGELMNGVLYTASGVGPHWVVMLFHGFPGNEQNLDLAQAMRRAGFDVLTMHYRGAWGSPGKFSFTHALEDSDAAVAFLRSNAVKFDIDAKRIFVAGHSMGGWMAASAAAHDRAVAGVILISAADMGIMGTQFHDPVARRKAMDSEFRADAIPLAGTTAEALMKELADHGAGWDFVSLAPQLKSRPLLLITSNDGLAAAGAKLAAAVKQAGGTVSEIHFPTDHSYSDHRIALESAVVAWLEKHSSATDRP